MNSFRQFIIGSLCLGLLLGLASVVHAQATPIRVAGIKVEGNLRTESQAIRRQILLKKGQVLDPRVIKADVRRIFRLQRFRDIQVEAEETDKGIIIIYKVKEKPAIRAIKILGHKELSLDDIKGVMNVKQYGILDLSKLQANVDKIRDLYREKGYYLAEVEYEVSKPKRASVVVTFRIRENAKIRIRQINFVGNAQVPSKKLRSVLQTSEHDLFSWISGRSTYQEALIARDLFFLQSYYLDNGYVMVKMGKPKVYLNRDKRFIYITYWITEGKTYRYRKIELQGDLKGFRKPLKRIVTIKKGELFSRSKLYRRNILAVTTLYQDKGYAYVNVTPRYKLDHKNRKMDLTLNVQKGPRVRVERIELEGNTDTQDKVIRREMRLSEGDYYSGSAVRISQRRIFALGFFAKTHPLFGVKVVTRRGSKPDRIIIKFILKEKPTGTFQIGAGFSSVESLVFNAQIAKNNLFGRGQSLSFAAQLSGIRQLFQLQFIEPYFFDLPITFAFSAFNSQRDFRTLFTIGFVQTTTGGTLTFGYQLVDDLNLLLTYKFERVLINASGNTLQAGIRLKGFFSGADGPTITSSFRLSLRYDKRNNRVFPTKGHFQSASIEVADWWTGSENRFVRMSATSRWYVSLPLNFVLRFNANVGWIVSPAARGVPAFERYRLGGINSIRGYRAFTVGPTRRIPAISESSFRLEDFNWGGNKQFVFNFEIEFPIIPKVGIKGVVFFDAGNAFDDNEFFFEDKRNQALPLGMYYSVGFGFRWFSPIGPLRFEWGIPLTPRAQDDPILFEFSIGNAF
ncbi:MAG: outer membrane protein assembly factor BamA [Deltaproteobacteria bacterium]|nr:MAG: outer membrane protein assembly factor BamA [Deltaproteobacteria bacterium]